MAELAPRLPSRPKADLAVSDATGEGKTLVPTVAIVGVTAGLIISDPHTMPYFRSHQRNWGDFNGVFNSYPATGEVGTPVFC